MKNLLLFLLVFSSMGISAQEPDQTNEIPSIPGKGKCIVYIARRETAALLVRFGIYDGDLFLGNLAAKKYFAYECNAGEHVFIAKGENTFYVDANLEEGRIYALDLKIKMGIMSGRVALVPLDKSDKKYEKEKRKFLDFMEKKSGEYLITGSEQEDTDEDDTETEGGISKRMRKYYEMKDKGKKMTTVTPDMYITWDTAE
ncbi:hypothetical protein IR083_19945 [Dysgonomonas sp. GY75]|uniref:hypothetical protein n=1 Tax=Dysgonomonas sp. GY75 TaxID=2780419 RepID=UPI0018835924|nr:hypothetical protein [Dysgonomonas sp. GY75]MBF0651093.1 hypothetical protein [Dysgonomonas sp. GY75]